MDLLCALLHKRRHGDGTQKVESRSLAMEPSFWYSLISLSKSVDPNKLPVNPVVLGERRLGKGHSREGGGRLEVGRAKVVFWVVDLNNVVHKN